MRPSKYILLFFATTHLALFCPAQIETIQEQEKQIIRQHQAQRKRIDSLQQLLISADDTTRINCLNRLSPEYYLFNTDTAWNCASDAYNLAVKINFTKGIAESLLNLAQITQERGNVSGAEKYFRQVPDLYNEIHDLKGYYHAVYKLSYSLKLQLRFAEARTLIEKNLSYYEKTEDETNLTFTYKLIGEAYHQQGYYEKAFEYFRQAMMIIQKNQELKGSRRDQYMWGNLYIADMYRDAGDLKTALSYYQLSAAKAKENQLPDVFNSRMGDIYVMKHDYDSARHYYELAHYLISLRLVDTVLRKFFLTDPLINIGETYLAQKQYDKAIECFKSPLQYSFPPNILTLRVLCDFARAYEGQKDFVQSFRYATQLLSIAQITGSRQYVRDGFELYWRLFDLQGKTDSAYKYHLLYSAMNDSIARDVQLRNMAVDEMKVEDLQKESKISLLNKEKKIQEQQKQFLFLGMAGIVFISIILFRYISLKRHTEINKRRQAEKELQIQQIQSEKTKAELQQQATEMEMQALRAQMNPHFIFNSLNSINRFILQNNKTQASEFLTKFSKLVRLILQNSQASLIPLESELESLELYLNLEALRFNYHFDYKISVPKDMDISALQVPPLILQPYVENAIWHGLMHKEEKGQLDVEVSEENDYLYFRITDNGIGREKAATMARKSATKHKSMGLRITAHRIAIVQNPKTLTSPVTINDLVNADGSAAGTEVVIKLPVIYD